MFLALGASFEGLADDNAASLIPSDLLDAMATPLRLFILETHVPSGENGCVAGYATPLEPYDAHPRLTLRGAEVLLSHRALSLVEGGLLTRCFSVHAGAIVFRAEDTSPSALPLQLGGRCHSWQLENLKRFCTDRHVRIASSVSTVYGHGPGTFVTYESAFLVDRKAFPVMRKFMDRDSPVCLAVYGLDLDLKPAASSDAGLCGERDWWCTLVESLHEIIKTHLNRSSHTPSSF